MNYKFLVIMQRSQYDGVEVFPFITNDIDKKYNIIKSETVDKTLNVAIEECSFTITILIKKIEYQTKNYINVDMQLPIGLENKNIFDVKDNLVEIFKKYFKGIIVQHDEHNSALCKMMYEKIHNIENKMRSIVNTVMTHEFGLNWFEDKVKGESFRMALNPNNDWYTQNYKMDPCIKKTVYNLYFKNIVDILTDNTDDLLGFELHKELCEIKRIIDKHDPSIIKQINKPTSYWEKLFKSHFSEGFIKNWETLNSIRNVIAHNKIIVPHFFNDSQLRINSMEAELDNVQEQLKRKYDEDYNQFIEFVDLISEMEYEELIFEQAGIVKFDEGSALKFIFNSIEFRYFECDINQFINSAESTLLSNGYNVECFSFELLENDSTILFCNDPYENKISISIYSDFYYERGGSCDYRIKLEHEYSKDYKEYFSHLSIDKYTEEDYPQRIDYIKVENRKIIIYGDLTLNFGDFKEEYGQIYPEQSDEVVINYWYIKEYLNDYLNYLKGKIKRLT